ncbi:mucin-5AC-like [Galendromus occidentalis]|uniref:Mucin-5AC-like n=1 Tax=Galendromus occidentalis TaxID=34638 RepID=A0AAJ7L5H8_9ACAR|nr:mucin-5AC-like [Galendromus occidentalis]
MSHITEGSSLDALLNSIDINDPEKSRRSAEDNNAKQIKRRKDVRIGPIADLDQEISPVLETAAAIDNDESVEYYDDDGDDNIEPQSSQNAEVRQNTTSGGNDDDDDDDDDPLAARPKTDPLQKLLPYITFDCHGRLEGYYADLQFGCEVFHYCKKEGKRFSFICPPNSTFNQKLMICDYDKIAKDTCVDSPNFFHLNKQLYGIKQKYKFPEYATSESQNIEQTVSATEATTSVSFERRVSEPETTPAAPAATTTAAAALAASTERPTTPTPKRAKIRSKLSRPTTTEAPSASAPATEEKPNPVKKPSRKRKPRPTPTPKPQDESDDAPVAKKTTTFKKKSRPSRKPQTTSVVQPAPPEHLDRHSEPRRPDTPPRTQTQSLVARPPKFESRPRVPVESTDLTAPRVPGLRPTVPSRVPPAQQETYRPPPVQPKRHRKKNRPPSQAAKNEVPEYDRMFSAERPLGTFPPQEPAPQNPAQPAYVPPSAPQQHFGEEPPAFTQPQGFPHQRFPPTQHAREPPVQHFHAPQVAQQEVPQFVNQQMNHPVPQRFPTQFTPPPPPTVPQFQLQQFPTPRPVQDAIRFSDPFPPKQDFDPGRQNLNGGTESHFFRGPEAVSHFGQSFGPTGGAAKTEFPSQVPGSGQVPQFDYVFPNTQQSPQTPFQAPQQPPSRFYQTSPGYSPVSTYDTSYGGLFGAATSGSPQTFFGAAPQTPSGFNPFQEQHVHHIHSRKRRSADITPVVDHHHVGDDIDFAIKAEDDRASNVAKSRQRRQSIFSRLPSIFSRKSNRPSNPFASASSMNPSFSEMPGFYGGRFNHQLSSESSFPGFGGSFARFASGPPQTPFGNQASSSIRVPSIGSLSGGPGANLFSRNRNPLNAGGHLTFTATSLGQVPSELGMSPNQFFSQASLQKPIQPKHNSAGQPQMMMGGSGEDIIPSPGTLSQTGLKPNGNTMIPNLPPGMQGFQQSAEVVEEDDKTAISYIPMTPGKITVTLDSIEDTSSGGSKATPMSFPPERLRPANPKQVLNQMRNSFRPMDSAAGGLTHPNDYISEVTPPGVKREPAPSNAVDDSGKSIPYPSHLARNPEKFPKFSDPAPKVNSFNTPQFLIPQTQFSPQVDGYASPPLTFSRGSYFPVKSGFRPTTPNKFLDFGGLPDAGKGTQRPIPAVRQPPPMPAHLESGKSEDGTLSQKNQKKRNKTKKRRPKPSTSTPLPPSMIEVVTHGDSGLNVHLKGGSDVTTLPSITTTPKRVWYGTTSEPPRYETHFPIKFNYITTGSGTPSTTTAKTFSTTSTTPSPSKRVYHNLVTPNAKNFEHKMPQRLEVTSAPLYKKNMFPPRVMATNVPHEMTAYAKYTTTPIPPSPPVMRTVDLSTTTTEMTASTTPSTVSTTSALINTQSSAAGPVTTPSPATASTATTTTAKPASATERSSTTARSSTEAPTTPDEIFDFFTFPTTSGSKETTVSPAPVFLPHSDISLNHDRQDEIIVIDTEKENMTASASQQSYSTFKPVLKVFSNRAGGTSWYKFKAMMATSTTPRPPLKMLNAVPVSDGYEKGFPFEFFTDLSLLSKTTGRPSVTPVTDFPQPVYNPDKSQQSAT